VKLLPRETAGVRRPLGRYLTYTEPPTVGKLQVVVEPHEPHELAERQDDYHRAGGPSFFHDELSR